VVYSEFQAGDLDPSVAAAAMLVIAGLAVLVAERAFHWGRALDVGGLGRWRAGAEFVARATKMHPEFDERGARAACMIDRRKRAAHSCSTSCNSSSTSSS
jgi:hypothetical protein